MADHGELTFSGGFLVVGLAFLYTPVTDCFRCSFRRDNREAGELSDNDSSTAPATVIGCYLSDATVSQDMGRR